MTHDLKTRERFFSKIRYCEHGGQCWFCCWLWTSSLDQIGYAMFWLHGKSHRRNIAILTLRTVAALLSFRMRRTLLN